VNLKEYFISQKPFFLTMVKTKKFKTFLILLFLYKSIFNMFVGNFIISKGINSAILGSYTGNVKQFSLFYGIVIEDLEILATESFQKESIFKTKRLSLQYNLPAFFLLRFKLSEISLSEAYINLHKVDGKWNFESLTAPSLPPKPLEPETEESSSTEINTYLPISAYLHFFIQNLNVAVKIEDKEKPLSASLEDFSLSVKMDTYRFTKIPLSLKATEILELFQIQLNKDNTPKISYQDLASKINTNMDMKLILNWDSVSKPKKFHSELMFGNEQIPIQFEGSNLPPFGIMVSYALAFDPSQDLVELKSFLVQFSKVNWLNISGKMEKVASNNPEINIVVQESKIDLNPLGDIVKKLPGLGDMDLAGLISLKGIKVFGTLNSLLVTSEIHGKDIIVLQGTARHSISKLDINIDSKLNLEDKTDSTDADVLPILDSLEFKEFFINYNGILITLKGMIESKTKVECELSILNIQLANFVKTLQGKTEVKVLIGGDKLSYLKLDTKVDLKNVRYFMGKSLSGKNDIQINLLNTVDLGSGFKFEKLKIDSFTLLLKNELKETAVQLRTKLDLELNKGVNLKVYDFLVNMDMTKLIPTLPVLLRNTIAGVRNGLGNNLSLGGGVDLSSQKEYKHIKLNIKAVLPGLELKDLQLNAGIRLNSDKEESIDIETLQLSGYDKKLKANYKGKFYKPFTANPPFGDYTGGINGNLTLESDGYKYLTKGIYFRGDIDFDLDIKGAIIQGTFKSKDSGFKITQDCPGENCSETEIAGLKMNIPFLHDINDKTMENLISGNAESFVQNYGLTKPPNFSIDRITSNHPIQKNMTFDYVKSSDTLPGISAFLEYKENFLILDNLKISTLDGVIFGKDFIVNVGTGDPSKIQYNAVLQVRDIDLKQILSPTSRKKIKDGKLKGDINISGQNLTDPVANVDLFFSIYQIGEDFGRSAVNIVSPTNFVTDRIINSYSVNKIEVEINHGLVYARVLFNKSIMTSMLFQVENDRIQQERIPLANFLKRAKSELSEYE
jgi:hypothetical protein